MRALHTAATGMMAQELNVQVISNNIANMRTTGYKRQRAEFQDMLNEFCWGKIWGDSTIPPKIRSMMNLTMLASLGRMHEWELHLNGALNNGVTQDELKAILHQIAIYAGFPAGRLDQFLKTGANKRTDAYGGSIEKFVTPAVAADVARQLGR
mgnify:CR=1 FL=1